MCSQAECAEGRQSHTSDEMAPSTAIAYAIAETLDRDVTDIAPLERSIDLGAVEKLIEGAERRGVREFKLEFRHEQCLVELDGSAISVTRITERPDR